RTLGNTMIYVTHDQLEALTLSDRIAVMRDGVLQQFGSPQEVYGSPANTFVAEFIGSPSMNLLPAQLTVAGADAVADLEGGGRLTISGGAADGLPRGSVIIGVRPDRLELEPSQSGWEIDVVEPIGSQAIVHICHGSHRARAIVPYPEGAITSSHVR